MNPSTSVTQADYVFLRKKHEKLYSLVAKAKKLEDLIDEAKKVLIKSQVVHK